MGIKINRADQDVVDVEYLRPGDAFRWCGEVYVVYAVGERLDAPAVPVLCLSVPRPFVGELDHGTRVVPVNLDVTVTESEPK